jgi:hypothetical protein
MHGKPIYSSVTALMEQYVYTPLHNVTLSVNEQTSTLT